MELFIHERSNYLVTVSYYSRFFELKPLRTTTSRDVIAVLDAMFAQDGVPRILPTDQRTEIFLTRIRSASAGMGSDPINVKPVLTTEQRGGREDSLNF